MDNIWKLLGGKLGKVVEIKEGSDWNEESCCNIIKGKEYEVGECVGEIDEFLVGKDLDELVLLRSDGYRGVLCYSGYMEVGGKMYVLDVINDYVVYEVIKKES